MACFLDFYVKAIEFKLRFNHYAVHSSVLFCYHKLQTIKFHIASLGNAVVTQAINHNNKNLRKTDKDVIHVKGSSGEAELC